MQNKSSPHPLSYASPSSHDPLLQRWGVAALIVAPLSILLHLFASVLAVNASITAAGVASTWAEDQNRILYLDPARFTQPDWPSAIALAVSLLVSILLSIHLLFRGIRLVRNQPILQTLRQWAWRRILISILIPAPAILLGFNLHHVHGDRGLPPLVDPRFIISASITLLAWAEILFPVIILRNIPFVPSPPRRA